tara:strand:- start:174 stop:368 length:195 start_codon:yes stop_codon:yes gene_type:complete
MPRIAGWLRGEAIVASIDNRLHPFIEYGGRKYHLPEEFLNVGVDAWNITEEEAICLINVLSKYD